MIPRDPINLAPVSKAQEVGVQNEWTMVAALGIDTFIQQGTWAFGHMASKVRGQKEMAADLQLSSPFYSVQDSIIGYCAACIQDGSSCSIFNLSRHTQRYISCVIPNPAKLTVKIFPSHPHLPLGCLDNHSGWLVTPNAN